LFSAATPEVFSSPAPEQILHRSALNPLEDHAVSLFLRKEKVIKDFVDSVANHVLQGSASELHVQPVNERPRDVLDKEVVGVPSRKVNVKDKR